jgi:hypothetical protein
MSSDDSDCEECGNCGGNVNVQFCYGCREDYCDECGFNGGCGVCDAEEEAFDKFKTSIETIKKMNAPEKSTKDSLQHLVQFMTYWIHQVECLEDDIVCMYYGDGGQHDGTEIMTDCGDSVLQEMEWFLEKASLICQGKYTFDTLSPE